MTNEEPQFLINEFLVKNQKELEDVIKELQPKNLPPDVAKVKFMRELTLNLCKAQSRINHKKELETKVLKLELEKKKAELLRKLNEPKKTIFPPIQKIKEELPLPPSPVAKETNFQQYITDPNVKEIICNGPDQNITIKYTNNETKLLPPLNKQELNHLIQDIAQQAKTEISPQKPFLATEINNKKVQANLGTEFLEPRLTIVIKSL